MRQHHTVFVVSFPIGFEPYTVAVIVPEKEDCYTGQAKYEAYEAVVAWKKKETPDWCDEERWSEFEGTATVAIIPDA